MKQLRLPRKDSSGLSYLSYSQISKFLTDIESFYEVYIENKPFEGNAYTDFGVKVGEALEKNDFSKFTKREQRVLASVPRLNVFEREIKLHFRGFYIKGFIDTASYNFSTIIDYKTGGKGKEAQYKEDKYTQLQLYSLGIKQEKKVVPESASVVFMKRDGNAFNGEKLTLAPQPPMIFQVDISPKRLLEVYQHTEYVAHEIEKFCKQFNLK